ncbi:MAG: hypothetical protein H3C34_12930 [Caldilineaceae bacterium]|nr:hypothetical protein [Caldilineaceae bacterium]
MIARLRATVLCDLRLQWRNGFYYAAGVVVVLFVLLLRLLQGYPLSWFLPALIVNNIIVNGFYFVSGLVLLERAEGTLDAQLVSPLRRGEYLAAKIVTLSLLALVENLIITVVVAGLEFQVGLLSAGILLGMAFFVLAGFAIVTRYDAVNSFLLPSLIYTLLLALPLLPYFGVGQGALLDLLVALHPLQPILVLLGAAVTPISPGVVLFALVAGACWVGIAYLFARRAFGEYIGRAMASAEQAPKDRRASAFQWPVMLLDRWTGRLGVLRALGPIDAKNVGRDGMLRWMVTLPFVVALAVRWILPMVLDAMETWLALDLSSFYPPLMGFVVLLIVPYFWGALIGFLLLDQRDDRTLEALQVTPLPLATYLLYRLVTPVLLSAATTVAVLPLSGLVGLPFWALLVMAIGVAPMAPLTALALAALAENKVQGLALMKAAGVVLLPPLVAYFAPEQWQWAIAVVPTYWPAQLLWRLQSGAADFVIYLAVGLVYQLALLFLLVRRFERVMYREPGARLARNPGRAR